MPGNQRGAVFEKNRGVAMMLGLNLQNGGRREIFQIDATLDLRLNDLTVYLITEVGVGSEEGSVGHFRRPVGDSIPSNGNESGGYVSSGPSDYTPKWSS